MLSKRRQYGARMRRSVSGTGVRASLFIVVFALLGFAPAPVTASAAAAAAVEPPPGSVRYVSPSGHDKLNDGLTQQTPWRTLSHAMTSMQPGQTLRVMPGVYEEPGSQIMPTLTSGTAAQPITVTATSPNVEIRDTLRLLDADYWIFEGLNVTGSGQTQGPSSPSLLGAVLELRGGTGWIFRNAEVCCYGAYTLVSISGDATNWTFSHNLVWSNHGRGAEEDQDHNIYVQNVQNSGPGFIERNIIAGARNGANIKLGRDEPANYGPTNVVVRSNTLVGAHENVRLAFRTQNSLVEDNLLVHANLPQDGQWAIDPYCLLSGGNIARNNAWSAISPTNPNEPTTTGAVGPNNPGLVPGCGSPPSGVLTNGGGHIARNPLFNTGQSGSTGATTALTEKTMELSGNQLGQINPSHFQPADAIARTYGRHRPFDQVIAGDWNGDGKDTPGGVIGNRVYLTNNATDPGSTSLSTAAGEADRIFAFGSTDGSDRYIAGDWNGDGKDEVGVYRRSNRTFYLEGQDPILFGTLSRAQFYQPIAGDWDGDGTDEVGYHDSDNKQVLLRRDDGSVIANGYQFGSVSRTYQPIAGDWNGDGKDEIGLWEANGYNQFHLRKCSNDTDSCAAPNLVSVTVPAPTGGAVYQPIAGLWTSDAGTPQTCPGTTSTCHTPAYVSWGTWNALKTNVPNTPRYTPRPYDG